MNWFERVLNLRTALRIGDDERPEEGLDREIEGTHATISRTLEYGIQTRDAQLHVLEHSTRVSLVASTIARQIGLRESQEYFVRVAAQLHEVGMFTVPPELLARRAPLSREELAMVRMQAKISAGVARVAHPPQVVRLIENQYADYQGLRETLSPTELLLAGIFRVADVLVAVTWPRPYQDPLPWSRFAEMLHSGAGSRFHPEAVDALLQP